MFTVEISDNVTDRMTGLSDTVGDLMSAVIRGTADTLTPFLKQNAPVGKYYDLSGGVHYGGQLRESLRFNVGEYGATLSGARQGGWVIGGTAPHMIQPRGARSVVKTHQELPQFAHLTFFWPRAGRVVTPPMVHHPGNRPNDFRWKAFQQAMDERAIQDTANRLMLQWAAGGAV